MSFRKKLAASAHLLFRKYARSVLDQGLFQSLLSMERKRAGRTGQMFALALLNLDGLDGLRTSEAVGETLRREIRDTDVVGWYKRPSTMGVIFTTCNGASQDSVRRRLNERIDASLSAALNSTERAKVAVSLCFFAEGACGEAEQNPFEISAKQTSGSAVNAKRSREAP